ncbi:MAG: MaoC/PaaZ C-terminal domain-containing protein [Pseudonocardiaceae bacterium]
MRRSHIEPRDIEPGTALPSRSFPVRRVDLVRYAGASGDFSVIHWSERSATSVGLPDVIAHGMLTMALALRVMTDWAGDPGAVVDYSVRFCKPVVVPDDGGVTLDVGGTVVERLSDHQVCVELVVRCGGNRVLAASRAIVRLA